MEGAALVLIHHMLSVRQIHPPAADGWLCPQSLSPCNTGAVLKVKMGETQTPPKADLLLGLAPARREWPDKVFTIQLELFIFLS